MFCTSCGQKISEGAGFCAACGTPAVPAWAPQGWPQTEPLQATPPKTLPRYIQRLRGTRGLVWGIVAGVLALGLALGLGLGLGLNRGENDLVGGTWIEEHGNLSMELISDGTATMTNKDGVWAAEYTAQGGELRLTFNAALNAPPLVYSYRIDGMRLYLQPAGSSDELVLYRDTSEDEGD